MSAQHLLDRVVPLPGVPHNNLESLDIDGHGPFIGRHFAMGPPSMLALVRENFDFELINFRIRLFSKETATLSVHDAVRADIRKNVSFEFFRYIHQTATYCD